MTARSATYLAAEINAAGGARELVLRDRSGLIPEDLILDGRPSPLSPARTALTIDIGDGIAIRHLTATQMTVLIGFLSALLDDAEMRSVRV